MGINEKQEVGIGFCDRCQMRLFKDETFIKINDEVLCSDCTDDMDEEAQ